MGFEPPSNASGIYGVEKLLKIYFIYYDMGIY